MKKTKPDTQIGKALKSFIAGADKPFTAENAAEAVAAGLKLEAVGIIPDIEELLATDNSLLEVTAEGELRETYVSRNSFFNGTEFCISPTQDEIDRGILFPGHRFVPFLNPEVPPFESILKSEDSEEELKIRTSKEFRLEDLEQYHSLLGTEAMLQYYVQNDPANSAALGEGADRKLKLKMKVFDMKEFYKKHSFKMGDALLIGVENQEKGIFRFSILPGSEKQRNLAGIQLWVASLEETLFNVFEIYGPAMDIQSQLEQALVLNPSLMEEPQLSFGEFLKTTRRICVKPFGIRNSILWHREENPADSLGIKPEISMSAGSVESLDRILQDLSIGLMSYEVEAFMRDELYNGRKSMDGVRKRCFGERELVFSDEAQQVAFENFIDELWEEVTVEYDRPKDEDNGRLRGKALSLLEDQISFVRRLDSTKVDPEKFPREEMASFSDISIVLGQLLNVLNNSGNKFEKDEMDKMFEMLDETVGTIGMIKASMIAKVPGLE